MSFLRELYEGETHLDFIGKRKIWFVLSGVLILVSVFSITIPKAESPCSDIASGLNCGIEFKGGIEIKAPLETGPLAEAPVTDVISELRTAIAPFEAGDAQIQVTGEGNDREVLVQTKEVADPALQEGLRGAIAETTGASVSAIDSQRIGRKWGQEITNKAVRALVIFLLVIILFMSWRFEWKMAIAALIALFHDLLITAGVYALVGFQVTPATLIALLTILGYSLYDTVVIFDRVDEEVERFAAPGKMTYQDAANKAVNTVLGRSINTSLTTLLPVGALLFVGVGLLGASTLKDLALALLIGIGVGTYSSIFVATPVLTALKEGEPRYRNVREKVLRDARRAEPAVAAVGEVEGPAPSTSPRPSGKPPAARARAGSKKARRRRRR